MWSWSTRNSAACSKTNRIRWREHRRLPCSASKTTVFSTGVASRQQSSTGAHRHGKGWPVSVLTSFSSPSFRFCRDFFEKPSSSMAVTAAASCAGVNGRANASSGLRRVRWVSGRRRIRRDLPSGWPCALAGSTRRCVCCVVGAMRATAKARPDDLLHPGVIIMTAWQHRRRREALARHTEALGSRRTCDRFSRPSTPSAGTALASRRRPRYALRSCTPISMGVKSTHISHERFDRRQSVQGLARRVAKIHRASPS